jgi:hypothetical protein
MPIANRQFVPEPKRHANSAVPLGLDYYVCPRILMKRLHDQRADLTRNGPTPSFWQTYAIVSHHDAIAVGIAGLPSDATSSEERLNGLWSSSRIEALSIA